MGLFTKKRRAAKSSKRFASQRGAGSRPPPSRGRSTRSKPASDRQRSASSKAPLLSRKNSTKSSKASSHAPRGTTSSKKSHGGHDLFAHDPEKGGPPLTKAHGKDEKEWNDFVHAANSTLYGTSLRCCCCCCKSRKGRKGCLSKLQPTWRDILREIPAAGPVLVLLYNVYYTAKTLRKACRLDKRFPQKPHSARGLCVFLVCDVLLIFLISLVPAVGPVFAKFFIACMDPIDRMTRKVEANKCSIK